MLLLVVLSMLVLFMLIGTTFLMTSNQSRSSAKSAAKLNRTGNYPTELLDRAVMQVIRDTENPFSAIRYHSLLRDLYGTDGFESIIYSPTTPNIADPTGAGQVVRYAGATAGAASQQLGPTQGQMIELYVLSDSSKPRVVKLERDMFGQPVAHTLPMTKGYYNGCLLTITTGPARGGTGRIVDYEFVGTPTPTSRIFRFRVMGFSRSDGTPLQITSDVARQPEIIDLAGQTFIVNGRAYNGTGVGYNPYAQSGMPRLTAMQLMQSVSGEVVGAEVALTPNSVYLPLTEIWAPLPGMPDPFTTGLADTNFQRLNQFSARVSTINYPSFSGPGGDDESYDAADFQNLFLALQSVTPRAQGRVVHSGGIYFEASDANARNGANFLRLDLEDLPLPSFHRPALVNYWYHRLLALISNGNPSDDHVRAILKPYQDDGTPTSPLTPQQAALITAIKRKISLRPIREDHPNFDGSNPQSRVGNLTSFSNLQLNGNIAIPFWEAVGPWDVDNDNDGINDSIWVDLGDPVTQAEDGTLYKPLYAFLIVDMDSRLNVNAHGLVDHLQPGQLDPTAGLPGRPGNLAHNVVLGGGLFSSNQLPQGIGYGPAEISLRPLLPQPYANSGGLDFSLNRAEDSDGNGVRDATDFPIDSYAALLVGRTTISGDAVSGRQGYILNQNRLQSATPGMNYQYAAATPATATPTSDMAQPDLLAQLKFIGYPLGLAQPSSFGSAPDLMGRYAIGLDYGGQPFYEVAYDRNPNAPGAGFANHALLTDSPYELNLGGLARRDTWAIAHDPAATAANLFSQSLVQNDDAPFATADLERVLRAFDADAGTLPSRLWDVVDVFDPVKLGTYDPLRVAATATMAFGGTSNPELLAAAQVMAGIARRLITTDSYSLPVPATNMAPRLLYGSDGLPGFPNVDDDGNGFVDDGQDYVAVVSDNSILFDPSIPQPCDDYIAVMRSVRNLITDPTNISIEVPQNPGLVDYLCYRIIVMLLRENRIANPMTAAVVENEVSRIVDELLAPEVVAGLKMDLNRPFGNGQNDNNNLVVDDPLEAGEPFLDLNANGKRDDGMTAPSEPPESPEPFIDLNGNQVYDAPSDVLWQNLTANGTLVEPIGFDHTNGHSVPLHATINAALPTPSVGGVRNLESQARQLYARHLYCLMLLVMDENYIAPFDEKDPQMRQWIDGVKKAMSITDAEAALVVARKNTLRQIAQWAINCADMRDADAIMTPFEYDENPWDGWGVLDNAGVLLPLDGDPATDENLGEAINWGAIDPALGGPKPPITALTVPSTNLAAHTRAVVWGAERPELLITETFATHDRRTEDLESPGPATSPGHGVLQPGAGPGRRPPDPHLDQSLRPHGSLFVELFNPWSVDGQKPAELYSKLDRESGYSPQSYGGIDLSRLSNFALSPTGSLDVGAGPTMKRSPVWRMIVVEDWPEARNRDQWDDFDPKRDKRARNKIPSTYKPMTDLLGSKWKSTDPPAYRMPNPDFGYTFDATFVPKQRRKVVPGETKDNVFDVAYPYIEREFYFTTDGSPTRAVNDSTFKLRIPNRSIEYGTGTKRTILQTQRFVPAALELPVGTVDIAPIQPGRYAVIGSAGIKYPDLPDSYTTTIGRMFVSGNTPDNRHFPKQTRRIELRPSRANFNLEQLLIAGNGGDPQNTLNLKRNTGAIYRDNELIFANGAVANITDSAGGTVDGVPDSNVYQPCVSVPIEGMNISEPAWGYEPREKEATEQAVAQGTATTGETYQFNPRFPGSKNEGRYVRGAATSTTQASFDIPFDLNNPELMRTGTTPNYRSIHLQRLANPLLPWNPEPKLANGKPNPEHQPNLPINPYRTVDSSSVDLTAFNGVSSREDGYANASTQGNLGQHRPWETSEQTDYRNKLNGTSGPPVQAWYMKSLERGHWNQLNLAGAAAVTQRELWAQEPAHVDLRRGAAGATRLIDGNNRYTTMLAPEVPGNPARAAAATGVDIWGPQEIHRNQVNAVLEHSLGHGNETMGLLYDQLGARPETTSPTPTAIGAPAAAYNYTYVDSAGNPQTVPINSTNPWFAWNNRPFVSAAELMQIPAASSAAMLSHYSAATYLAPTTPTPTSVNPYEGSGLSTPGPTPTPVAPEVRLAQTRSPFGHLLNFFSTAGLPANVLPPSAANDTIPDGIGAPHYYRFLDYVQVPSRFVGTETVLTPEVFNDVANVADTAGSDIVSPNDPRYRFQAPFNKVSERRDPGKVNLNTVIGRRTPANLAATPPVAPQIWSEVYDGIMHRYHDALALPNHLPHFGPAWRDVVMSRRGYPQVDAVGAPVDTIAGATGAIPDTLTFGLNNQFPTFFVNPFRSSNAGDLVPLPMMMRAGVQASLLRSHPYVTGRPMSPAPNEGWGLDGTDDNGDGLIDDAREAGYGNDMLAVMSPIASRMPLFSEGTATPAIDAGRNPYMMYQPMTRLGNLVTTRSGVFAIWVTVGYFEVEPAPDFATVQTRFLDAIPTSTPNRQAMARALYDRVYPEGYMLGQEVGSETGNTRRARGFYIVDRTEAVGFKPGEDLNVDNAIRLRRRIE